MSGRLMSVISCVSLMLFSDVFMCNHVDADFDCMFDKHGRRFQGTQQVYASRLVPATGCLPSVPCSAQQAFQHMTFQPDLYLFCCTCVLHFSISQCVYQQ